MKIDRTTWILVGSGMLILGGACVFACAASERRSLAALVHNSSADGVEHSTNGVDERLARLRDRLEALASQLSPDVPSAIETFTQLLTSAAIRNRSLKSGQPDSTGDVCKTPVTATFNATFEQLAALLTKMENTKNGFRVVRLQATYVGQDGELDVAMQLELFSRVRKG